MKLTVSRNELANALAIASSASSTRTALPVLSSIRFEAKGSGLTLLGCDGEMWAECTVPANVEMDGVACVQQKLLSDIVGSLPDGEVRIDLEGTSVIVRHTHTEFKMMVYSADEFPPVPEISPQSELTMPFGEFYTSVGGVLYATSDDSSRPVLTGVLFTYDGSELTLVATDTHRLAVQKIHRDGMGSQLEAIVPAKALKALRQMPLENDENIAVGFDDSRLTVNAGGCRIVSQLLVGQYPNWERVIPQDCTRTWTVDRQEFHDNLRRAMILARDNANRVKFTGEGDTIIISARSEDKGEAKEEVACVSKNGDVKIAFNGDYVMQAIASMSSDGILAEMTEPSRPAVLRPTDGGENKFCVVMPMALD